MANNYDDQLDESNVPDANNDGFNEYDDLGDEIAARKVGSEPIPSAKLVVLAPRGATPSFAFDDKTRPIIRHRFEVIEGPDGTVGKAVFVDQQMAVQRDKWTDQKDANGKNIREPLSADELGEAILTFKNILNRVAHVFGLELKAPKDKSMVALGAYAEQFEKAGKAGLTFIGEVKKSTRNGFTKNMMYFDSIAMPSDPPTPDYRGKAKTALDEAREYIVAKNKGIEAQAKKNGSRGNSRVTTSASAAGLD